MTDPELDDLLRRYRPAGPPPELRARVAANAGPVRRTWPWAAAAAALLAATVYLHESTDRLAAGARVNSSHNGRQEAIALLSETLGGDASAQMMADLIISTEEMRVERDRGIAGSQPAQEAQ